MQLKEGNRGEFNTYFTKRSKVVSEAWSYDEIKAIIKTHVNFIHLHSSKNDDSAYIEYECLSSSNKPVSVRVVHNYPSSKVEVHRQKQNKTKDPDNWIGFRPVYEPSSSAQLNSSSGPQSWPLALLSTESTPVMAFTLPLVWKPRSIHYCICLVF